MFGFFKKKKAESQAAPLPPVPDSIAELVGRQFEEFAEGDIDPVEGALTMFRLDQDRYVHRVIDALGKSVVELLLRENNPHTAPLMLQSDAGFPMLPVFTQRRRVEKCQAQFPEYQFYLRLPFVVVLEQLKAGAGIVINPFEEVVTWTLPPELVGHVKEAILPENPKETEAIISESPKEEEVPASAKYLPGQVWSVHGLESHPEAELTILHVEKREATGTIVHVAVAHLKLPNGGTTIGHMPFTQDAIDRSVAALSKSFGPVPDFFAGYKQWSEANGGVFTITVAEAVDFIQKDLLPSA